MISLNEIENRAAQFVKEWRQGKHQEEAEAQTFETEFLNIFGIKRKQVAAFEQKVKIDKHAGYIDLFWPGHIMIEMKSTGKDLSQAFAQALEYYNYLPADTDEEKRALPSMILISDFENFDIYDMEKNAEKHSFSLNELEKHLRHFYFLAGYGQQESIEENPVDRKAAEKMGHLHDALKEAGYTGHSLEVYLVRLLFCLFAEDTGIFNDHEFVTYIKQKTAEDGSDLGAKLAQFFSVLNQPQNKRMKTLDHQLNNFPYINGGLFAEQLEFAEFDSAMRECLIECASLDWSGISPDIFGAMFQSIMNSEERHDFGAHYTSAENIKKLIRPLFLDELNAEFEEICSIKNVKDRNRKLQMFQDKLAALTFLDPACGCGNFLLVTYKELRELELRTLEKMHEGKYDQVLDISLLCKVNIQQFFGIEILDFPCQVAHVSMWLMDHLCNKKCGKRFGQVFKRIPLTAFENIKCGNALQLDWNELVPAAKLDYIIGNPPFLGARVMESEQKADMAAVFGNIPFGNLDYVSSWYIKAAQYMQNTEIKTAFVSSNSICQGEQVALLWKPMLQQFNMKINFAHQTFKWSNEAKNNAAVYCVIVGFSQIDVHPKRLFTYETVKSSSQEVPIRRLNPYLCDAPDVFIDNRTTPLCDVPEIGIGNKPIDDGNYLFSKEERDTFIKKEPKSAPYFKAWYGADEFIYRSPRYCLWLGDCSPAELNDMPKCLQRVQNVRNFRLASKSEGTRKIADTPTRFHVENMPSSNYILIPCHSSENRYYVPMGYLSPKELTSNAVQLIPDAALYHFGILTSSVHMAWMRTVCGRLELRYRYSKGIVYNNFPWPQLSDKQKEKIGKTAQQILDVRNLPQFAQCNYNDLYDSTLMPPELRKAHQANDAVVMEAYGFKKGITEPEIVAELMKMYQKLLKKEADSVQKKNNKR